MGGLLSEDGSMDAELHITGLWKHNIYGSFPLCWTIAGCHLAFFWYSFLSWDNVTLPPYQYFFLSWKLKWCPMIHLVLAKFSCHCQWGHPLANMVMVWTLVLIPSWMNYRAKKLRTVSRPGWFYSAIQTQLSSLASCFQGSQFCSLHPPGNP